MSYLTLLITIPLTIFAVLFAVSNDADVSVGLWPLDGRHEMPIYALGLGMLIGGFLLGALFVSILAQKTRFLFWQEQRKRARLEKELDSLHAKTHPAPSTPKAADTSPQAALPAK